jgi:hypothetical protein
MLRKYYSITSWGKKVVELKPSSNTAPRPSTNKKDTGGRMFESRIATLHGNEFGSYRHAVPTPAPARPTPAPSRPHASPARAEIKQRLEDAGVVLYLLPEDAVVRALRGGSVSWPQVLHERADHGAWDRAEARPATPTAAELSALDRVFDWLLCLDGEQRRVVSARMCGVSYRKISATDRKRRSYRTLARIYEAAITAIENHLAGAESVSR